MKLVLVLAVLITCGFAFLTAMPWPVQATRSSSAQTSSNVKTSPSLVITIEQMTIYCQIEKAKGRECDLTGITIAPSECELDKQSIVNLEHDVRTLQEEVGKLTSGGAGLPLCPADNTTSWIGRCLVWRDKH